MQTKHERSFRSHIVALLLAFEVVLSFSSFGYITVGRFTLSFIPAIVYFLGYLCGPVPGILGGVLFGLTSMWVAGLGLGTALDALYSPVLSGNPIASIMLAVGTRLLLGMAAGFILPKMRNLKKHRSLLLAAAIAALQLLYSGVSFAVCRLAFSTLVIETGDVWHFLIGNYMLEFAVSAVLLIALSLFAESGKVQKVLEYCRFGLENIQRKWSILFMTGVSIFFTVYSFGTFARFFILSERVFNTQVLTETARRQLVRLEVQQQLSYLALSVIIIILAMIIYLYFVAHQTKLSYRADRDMMTSLFNRPAFKSRIELIMKRYPGEGCAFMLIDIDDLKDINDTLGHSAGDEAIIGMAKALSGSFRDTDLVARVGGDEFAVFLRNVISEESLRPILERMMQRISAISISGGARLSHGSVGVVMGMTGEDDVEDLYRCADKALYLVKNSGKNAYAFYSQVHKSACKRPNGAISDKQDRQSSAEKEK